MDVNIVNAIAIFAILIIATTAIVAMDCNGGRRARDKNWYDGDVRITPLKKLDYKLIRNYNEEDLYSLFLYGIMITGDISKFEAFAKSLTSDLEKFRRKENKE